MLEDLRLAWHYMTFRGRLCVLQVMALGIWAGFAAIVAIGVFLALEPR